MAIVYLKSMNRATTCG